MTRPLPLFVYGTLAGSGPQGTLLAHLSRTAATTRGELWALPAGYPALVAGPPGVVHGEIVSPPHERLLELLDLYEGVAEGIYIRARIPVTVGARTEAAWAYVMDAARARTGVRLRDGRWGGRRTIGA